MCRATGGGMGKYLCEMNSASDVCIQDNAGYTHQAVITSEIRLSGDVHTLIWVSIISAADKVLFS